MQVINANGLKCLYQWKDTGVCSVRFLFNVGSLEEDEKIFGSAHYLEHMFFKGTKTKGYKKLNQELSKLGEYNAGTFQDKTVYYIDCLSTDFKKAFNLLAEMLFENQYKQSEFDKEKGVILEECQMYLDSPSDYFQDNASLYAFGDLMHYIIGTKTTISDMSIKSLNQFKEKFYNGNNMVAMVVGKISEDDVKDCLIEMRKKYHSHFVGKQTDTEFMKLKLAKQDVKFTHNSEQAHIAYFFPVLDLDWKKDTIPVAEIFEAGFGGGSFSILFDEIREKMGLCYSISYWEQYCRGNVVMSLCSQLDRKNVGKARGRIDKIIAKVKKEGFDKKTLEIAKQNSRFKLQRLLESAKGVCSLNMNYFSLGLFDVDKFYTDMLMVTNDEIIDYANKVLSDDKIFICMNGDKKCGKE